MSCFLWKEPACFFCSLFSRQERNPVLTRTVQGCAPFHLPTVHLVQVLHGWTGGLREICRRLRGDYVQRVVLQLRASVADHSPVVRHAGSFRGYGCRSHRNGKTRAPLLRLSGSAGTPKTGYRPARMSRTMRKCFFALRKAMWKVHPKLPGNTRNSGSSKRSRRQFVRRLDILETRKDRTLHHVEDRVLSWAVAHDVPDGELAHAMVGYHPGLSR